MSWVDFTEEDSDEPQRQTWGGDPPNSVSMGRRDKDLARRGGWGFKGVEWKCTRRQLYLQSLLEALSLIS